MRLKTVPLEQEFVQNLKLNVGGSVCRNERLQLKVRNFRKQQVQEGFLDSEFAWIFVLKRQVTDVENLIVGQKVVLYLRLWIWFDGFHDLAV